MIITQRGVDLLKKQLLEVHRLTADNPDETVNDLICDCLDITYGHCAPSLVSREDERVSN